MNDIALAEHLLVLLAHFIQQTETVSMGHICRRKPLPFSDWRLWYKNTFIYEITEVKTVAGQQLLKDKIAVTLPIKMTPDEVKKLSADTSKGEYNDAENMWYFYDATYEITNNAKFTMPKAA